MRKIISLNRKWSFRKGINEVPAVTPADWDFVNIPHCWNAIDGQDGGNDLYRGTAYYAKELEKIDKMLELELDQLETEREVKEVLNLFTDIVQNKKYTHDNDKHWFETLCKFKSTFC